MERDFKKEASIKLVLLIVCFLIFTFAIAQIVIDGVTQMGINGLCLGIAICAYALSPQSLAYKASTAPAMSKPSFYLLAFSALLPISYHFIMN
jgi:hypothetical protein